MGEGGGGPAGLVYKLQFSFPGMKSIWESTELSMQPTLFQLHVGAGGEGKGVKGRGEGGVWEDFLWKVKLCIIETK
jgi:hypothetical protein